MPYANQQQEIQRRRQHFEALPPITNCELREGDIFLKQDFEVAGSSTSSQWRFTRRRAESSFVTGHVAMNVVNGKMKLVEASAHDNKVRFCPEDEAMRTSYIVHRCNDMVLARSAAAQAIRLACNPTIRFSAKDCVATFGRNPFATSTYGSRSQRRLEQYQSGQKQVSSLMCSELAILCYQWYDNPTNPRMQISQMTSPRAFEQWLNTSGRTLFGCAGRFEHHAEAGLDGIATMFAMAGN